MGSVRLPLDTSGSELSELSLEADTFSSVFLENSRVGKALPLAATTL
jgi:hypothetical protein